MKKMFTNSELLDNAWPILEAIKAGKDLLTFKSDGKWIPVERDDVTLAEVLTYPNRYRPKPEPREWWIVGSYAFTTKLRAEADLDFHSKAPPIIHVREVLD
jgi:hypothetical protein